MPREGLSETGQIIAAVATAIILALLAKYGLLPDEDGGKKEGDDNGGGGGNPGTVINIQIGGERLEDVARAGREAMTPLKTTPPRVHSSGVEIPEEPFEDLTVGALPIKGRRKEIMANIGALYGEYNFYNESDTMRLVVVLDSIYGTRAKIGVWAFDPARRGMLVGAGWSLLPVHRVGVFQGQLHFVVLVPVRWDAKDASGRVRELMVLCRTDDATKAPDPRKAREYVERAREDGSDAYRLQANKPLTLFDDTTGLPGAGASLMAIGRETARTHLPAIYIPKGPKELLSTG